VRGKSHLVPNTQHKMALGARQIPKYLLKKARDTHKDQSYFLYRLNQKQLRHILFPLGNYTKSQVRRMAKEFALPIADKLASQEICFLPDADYHGFLKTQTKTELKAGPILDKEGNLLGKHKGIAFYTLGQRQGLGIARGYPLYVTKIDAQNNTIRVGKKEEAYAGQFSLKDTHFILKKPQKKEVALKVRIRYNHPEAPARVMFSAARIKVKFKRPQFAITPGQSAVFYDKDTVLGGGIIDRVVQ